VIGDAELTLAGGGPGPPTSIHASRIFAPIGTPTKAIVDPEALLLLSLGAAEWEARIGRLIPWWAKVGAGALSVQRVKNLVSEYPPGLGAGLGRFPRSAMTEGGDHRWRVLAGRTAAGAPRAKDAGASPIVSAPPALMLRLRLAFGVGIKADVLAFLLGMVGARRTVQEVARATRVPEISSGLCSARRF